MVILFSGESRVAAPGVSNWKARHSLVDLLPFELFLATTRH
jgi:hypothetical protein